MLGWSLDICCLSAGFVYLWSGLVCLFADLFGVRLSCYLSC